jgi:formylmethanofuran dehydrogenase subunit E
MSLPDYKDLAAAHDREKQKELDGLPVCSECDKPIQDDVYYEFDGEFICESCLKENHRKWTDEYID